MKCPNCESRLKVTNSYQAGNAGITQRLFCEECLTTVSAVTVLVQVNPNYGQGAKSLAHKIKNGKMTLVAKENDQGHAEEKDQ